MAVRFSFILTFLLTTSAFAADGWKISVTKTAVPAKKAVSSYTKHLGQILRNEEHLEMDPATSKASFCEQAKRKNYFQELILSHRNRMGFTNGPYGLQSGGVCWWHSRLQRAATYITYYAPSKRKPTRARAQALLQEIRAMDHLVEIPGYANWSEFSYDYQKDIIAMLEDWQISQGIWGMGWLDGASRSELTAEQTHRMLDQVKRLTQQGEIVFLTIPFSNSMVTAHSMLITEVKRESDLRPEARSSKNDIVFLLDPNYFFISTSILGPKDNKIWLFPTARINQMDDIASLRRAISCGCNGICH